MSSFIVPISSNINVSNIDWIDKVSPPEQNQNGTQPDGAFKEIFEGLVNNVEATQAQSKIDAYNLSIGNMDDMHTMIINATKAEVALQTMVELRNKMLDAYTEVMRTNL